MSLPYRNHKKKRPQTYILIGDGFDELEVVYFLHKFRRAGLSIKSVSLFNKLVFSRQGVGLKADFALADKPMNAQQNSLLILPAGGRNGEALRHDARVKSLLQEFGGEVVVTDGRSTLANDVSRLVKRPSHQPISGQALDEFADSLADRFILAS